jgi:hypothetical protein
LKNKHLVLIFLLLLVAIVLSRKQLGNRERSFQAALVQCDTAAVSQFVIQAPGAPEFSITREDDRWILSDGTQSHAADPESVQKLLLAVQKIESQQIIAKDEQLWNLYGLDEAQATRIQIFQGRKLLHDFLSGGINFDPNTQRIVAFIRLYSDKTVFATNGQQLLAVGKTYASYRNLVMLKMKREMEIQSFTWELPDTTFEFRKSPNGWTLNDNVLDSMEVENYLNVFRNISGEQFARGFDEIDAAQFPVRTLKLKGQQIPELLVLTCYQDSTRIPPFILNSSQNPQSYFEADSMRVFQEIFPDIRTFFRAM